MTIRRLGTIISMDWRYTCSGATDIHKRNDAVKRDTIPVSPTSIKICEKYMPSNAVCNQAQLLIPQKVALCYRQSVGLWSSKRGRTFTDPGLTAPR